jgi:hypothetical protein
MIEVSSFSTSAQNSLRNTRTGSGKSNGSYDEDSIRFNNCLQRDFTINGLMFDPYAKVIYDYLGGIEDIKKAKVRTVFHAGTSFQEDSGEFSGKIIILCNISSMDSFPKSCRV